MADTVNLGWESFAQLKSRLQSRALVDLFEHWDAIRDGTLMPSRAALDPTTMPYSLPYIWMGDVNGACGDFIYRLAGEALNTLHGRSLKGCSIAEVVPIARRHLICARFERAVGTPAVVYNFGQVYAELAHHYLGERLILPLGRPDGTVTQLIGATYWVWGGAGLALPEGAADAYVEVSAAISAAQGAVRRAV